MKPLTLIVTALFCISVGLSAQDKDNQSENIKSDSTISNTENADSVLQQDYKSTKIESNEKDNDWDDWDSWKEDRKDSWKSSRKRGFFRGGAGGWDFYIMDLSVDEINTKLTEIGIPEFDSRITMNGGGGWAFLGHGFRIGGLGAHGQVKSSGGDKISNGTRINKEVTLSINFGGFLIEKVYHPFNKTELYLGTTIGGGNTNLKFNQWSGAADWSELWNGYNNDWIDTDSGKYTDYENELSCGYFTVLPTIGFRYNFFRWAAVGVNVGYLYMHRKQEGWRMDGKAVSGAPDIDVSNIIYRLNFYFGG